MLENTHLFPSPLSIQWSFSDCGSSPPTKHRPLPHFTVREWGVYTYMHIYADTRTHAHIHFYLGWKSPHRKSNSSSRASPAVLPVSAFCGIKEDPSPPSPRCPPVHGNCRSWHFVNERLTSALAHCKGEIPLFPQIPRFAS